MKKSLIISALFLLGYVTVSAAGADPVCYVKTADEVYFGQKLKIGLLNTKIVADDGSTVKIPNREVTAYRNGSTVYELMPLIDNDPETPQNVMMELISVRSDFKLFSYDHNVGINAEKQYFVYQNSKLTVRITPANAKSVFGFFGLEAW